MVARYLLLLSIVLRISDGCTAFDGSTLTPRGLFHGVTDSKGIQGMLNRALGEQTHIGKMSAPISLGSSLPLSHKDWVFDASELACADFDGDCRWKNMEGLFVDEMDWYQGSGFLDQGRLQVATGTHIAPEGPYSIVATDKTQLPTSKAILVSDTVGCQIGPGEIKLQYWTSPEVRLVICTKRVSRLFPQYDYCSPPIDEPSPGPVSVALPDSGREPFQIYIIADNFVYQATSLQGGFAIIDNLEYTADMCSTDEEAAGPGAPRDNSIMFGRASSTAFPELVQLQERPDEESEKSGMMMHATITRKGPLPHGKVQGRRRKEEEEDQRPQRNGIEEDEDEFEGAPISGNIAEMIRNSVSKKIMKDACEVLNCRFNDDCNSLLDGTEWRQSDRPIGNPLTGIKGDASLLPYNKEGSFAYLRGPRSHSRLTTASFRLGEDAFFIFAYHKVDSSSSFRVYAKRTQDENEILLFDAPALSKNSSRRWFREGRMLPAGDYEYIAFEVHALSPNNYVGVDEILVLNSKRQLMCP